ncbi:MAG: phosphoglucosamine mutase, partial [Pseudomonadota bacterium]
SRKKQNRLEGGVVGTLMSNFGLELALKDLDIPFVRAKVGDRYVMQELKSRGWTLGGESSGHLICLDKTTTGDGLVSALQVLSQLKFMQRPLHELASEMPLFPQKMINVTLAENSNASDICELEAVKQAIAKVEGDLADKGRILLRPSGTEPVIRVMVEGEDSALVERSCQTISDVVAAQI